MTCATLPRYRKAQIAERSRAVQRLDKVLQDAGIKLTSVACHTLGVSARDMLNALVAGQYDPLALAELARGRLRAKIPALREALEGRFRGDHHGVILARMLAHIDTVDEGIAALEERIGQAMTPYVDILELVTTIPGVKPWGQGPHRADADRRVRRGHVDLPQRWASRVVGGDLPRQPRLGRQTPLGPHPPWVEVAAMGADRGCACCRCDYRHLSARASCADPRPPRRPEGGRRDPPRHSYRLLPHRLRSGGVS